MEGGSIGHTNKKSILPGVLFHGIKVGPIEFFDPDKSQTKRLCNTAGTIIEMNADGIPKNRA